MPLGGRRPARRAGVATVGLVRGLGGRRLRSIADGDRSGSRGRKAVRPDGARLARSEEHTSELQSLMRISYAVFCLKKKTIRLTEHHTTSIKAHHPQSQPAVYFQKLTY